MDSAIRDLAALRGTYRLIPETDHTIDMMISILSSAGVNHVVILLDQPVSNSGRLKTRIVEISEKCDASLDIQVRKDVDRRILSSHRTPSFWTIAEAGST